MHVTSTAPRPGPSVPSVMTPRATGEGTPTAAVQGGRQASPGAEGADLDALDSLVPTRRVAPLRTETPPSARRRWRPRPALTEVVVGMAGFMSLVTMITAPAAAWGGRGLTLAMVLAVALPPVVAAGLLQRGTTAGAATRSGLAEVARLLCGLATSLAVGLSVGGVAWVVVTAPADPMEVLEPVLVASAYSLVTAVSAGLLAWRLCGERRAA